MLHALEHFLEPAIAAALPNTVTVVTGPYEPAGQGAVAIYARTLAAEAPAGDSESDGGAYLLSIHTWPADGVSQDFLIPPAETGELLEVEAPPGKLAAAGSDYFLEDRTIKFYRAPAAGTPAVRARLRGDDAAGWQRRRPCTIELELGVWAGNRDDADARLDIALQVALAQMVAVPVLELDSIIGADVSLRLLSPRVWLSAMKRDLHRDPALHHASAQLEVRGELDALVARGAPAPIGVIEQVVVEEKRQLRLIDSESIDVLAGIGPVSTTEFAGLTPPVGNLRELADLDVDAIADQLSALSVHQVRAFVRQATTVLAFPMLPPLAAAVLDERLANLAALSPANLATLMGTHMMSARFLLAKLDAVRGAVTADALTRLTLRHYL